MPQVTFKQVQTHFECTCGYNCVDHEELQIRWKDLSRVGIVRKKDKTTGKPFLLMRTKSEQCNCNEL